jgi:predicted O-methyltransferase YrrM
VDHDKSQRGLGGEHQLKSEHPTKKTFSFFSEGIFSAFNSKKDSERLIREIPELQDFRTVGIKHWEQLQPYYKEYISTMSVDHMAISPELSILLMILCHALKPKSILDLGSGFSSFVFRTYLRDAAVKPKIDSIDDSEEWLNKTRTFLSKYHLPTEKMNTWPAFLEKNKETFDFILYDLGRMDVREKMLEKVFTLVSPGGIVILDDIHKKQYRSHAKKLLKRLNLQYYTLESFIEDKFGRYAVLVKA